MFRQVHGHGGDVLRLETWIHFKQPYEAAYQESGSYEQNQRKSDLGNREQSANASATIAGGRASAAFLKRLAQTRRLRLQSARAAVGEPVRARISSQR